MINRLLWALKPPLHFRLKEETSDTIDQPGMSRNSSTDLKTKIAGDDSVLVGRAHNLFSLFRLDVS